MTKTISSPHMGMAASFGRKPCPPSKAHCFGADHGGKTCGERQTCALHQRQLSDPVGGAMRLPRVGANPCHFRPLSRPDPPEWVQIVAPRAVVRHNGCMQHIEHQHQVALIEWARQTAIPPALDVQAGAMLADYLLAIPNGGRRRMLEAVRLKAEGVKPGVSDLLLPLCRNGRSGFWLEMKAPRKKPTAEQRAWIERMRLAGYCAEWADDWTKAAGMLAGYIGVRAPGVA